MFSGGRGGQGGASHKAKEAETDSLIIHPTWALWSLGCQANWLVAVIYLVYKEYSVFEFTLELSISKVVPIFATFATVSTSQSVVSTIG